MNLNENAVMLSATCKTFIKTLKDTMALMNENDLPLNDRGVCTVEGVISFSFVGFRNHSKRDQFCDFKKKKSSRNPPYR